MLKKLAGPLVFIAIFLAAGEGLSRVAARLVLNYDLEMTRYGLYMKEPSRDPLIGHVHQPNLSAHLMGVDLRTNSDGFRDHEYPIEKRGVHRVVFLGDSLTLGWGVDEDKTFKTLLERDWNRDPAQKLPVEVLNFGTGNYNTEQETHLFVEKGLKYNPDRAVMFYFINDAEVTPHRSKTWFLGYSYLFTYSWSGIRTLWGLVAHGKGYQNYYASLYTEANPGWPAERAAFRDLRDLCRDRGIQLQVVLLPELHQLNPYPFTREHQMVARTLADLGVSYLDLAPAFAGERHPERLWVSHDDAHPNAVAHQLIAADSRNYLLDLPFRDEGTTEKRAESR
jgi:lysophospholipase L1-like esterase